MSRNNTKTKKVLFGNDSFAHIDLPLYEKMGYVRTGKPERINEKTDIVFYEQN